MNYKSYKLFTCLLIALFIPIGLLTSSTGVILTINADSQVNWTPDIPAVGDVVTITYNTSTLDAKLDSSQQIYLVWGMYVPGNEILTNKEYGYVPPSTEMWPNDSMLTPLTTPYVNPWRTARSPMINNSETNLWEISFVLNEFPDYLFCYFVNAAGVKDDNSKNYWFIHTALEHSRIRVQYPAMNVPLIVLPNSEVITKVEASEDAINWNIELSGSGTTVTPPVSAVYIEEEKLWNLEFIAPSSLGIYDLVVSATIDGIKSSHREINSIKIIKAFKETYTFAILGDPQLHRDGSGGLDYCDDKTGIGNFSDVLKELNTIHPEFILCMGDLTEWTDEIALNLYPKWLDLYLDDIPFISVIGNHGDFESTASGGLWEWGSGMGTWLEKIGPNHGTFWYKDHAFILSDSNLLLQGATEQEEIDYLNNEKEKAEKANAEMTFYLIHEPVLEAEKADAVFSGHMHEDYYSLDKGIHYIITTESVGEFEGYRLVEISKNEIEKFSYEPAIAATNSAPSWPLKKVNVTYLGSNDGTESTISATMSNGLNHELKNAHLRFIMDPSNEYAATGGTVVNSFIEDGARIVDVELNVSATTNHSVSLEIYIPITTTTNSTITTTTGEKSTNSSPIVFIFPAIIVSIIIRRKRRIF